MPRVDFYVLKDGRRGDRFALACRLVERIYHSNDLVDPGQQDSRAQDTGAQDTGAATAPALAAPPQVLIHCPDPQQARHLDRLLWSFRENSFLPHGLVDEVDTELTPILISQDEPPEQAGQVLINLSPTPEVPLFVDRFERICEPLDHDPEIRQAGRRRYLHYRDSGYALHHHAIG